MEVAKPTLLAGTHWAARPTNESPYYRGNVRPLAPKHKAKFRRTDPKVERVEDSIFLVKNVSWDQYQICRAGVILCTMHGGELFFGLGKDVESQDFTDFGGGIKKTDLTPVSGAIREFMEESCNVFPITETDVDPSYCLIQPGRQHRMLILFLRIDCQDASAMTEQFDEARLRIQRPEMDEIRWFAAKDFHKLVYSQIPGTPMYSKVRNMLRVSIPFPLYWDFIDSLKTQPIVSPLPAGLGVPPVETTYDESSISDA